MARQISSVKYIVLLLSFSIFNITSRSIYLPIALLAIRTSIVKLAYLLEQDPNEPYYLDALEKYFAHPNAKGL